ncbi:MAG TPA: hypothetical protein VMB50_14895 [Myxococcales bacterium]|nr:hypothetical protein [Myxococcales bacterium]
MLKICPRCHRTFSGGRLCLDCEGSQLLDVAAAGTRPHLRRAELQHTINTYYGARSAMLLLFLSILLGGAVAFGLARAAFAAPAGRSWWFGAAGLALVGIPLAGLLGGARVVRWFSVCRGHPPMLDDLRASLRKRRSPT